MPDRTPHSLAVSLHLLGNGRIGAKRASWGGSIHVWIATAPDEALEQTTVGITMTEQDARRLRDALISVLGGTSEVAADA